MTQRNSCTTWVGSERLNSEPNSTLLGRHRNFRYLNSGSHLVPAIAPTQPVPHKGGWTNAISKPPRRILCKEKHSIVERGSGDVS